MKTVITIIEARYKPDYFPMKKGTKWRIGELTETDQMLGSEYYDFPHGNKAKGVDEDGNFYALWTYVSNPGRLEFAVRPFNEGTTSRAIREDGSTWMWY